MDIGGTLLTDFTAIKMCGGEYSDSVELLISLPANIIPIVHGSAHKTA